MKLRLPFFIQLLLLLCVNVSFAQNINSTPIPIDSTLVKKTLSNGFTYYLQQNDKPNGHVHFQMEIKAGSILETEEQRGFAHFLEHMVFNGSKHFPENSVIDYFQTVGVEFGGDINAFTSYDQTVYMLPLSYSTPEILNNVFYFFGDIIGSGLTLNTEDIDSERKIIFEEWRTTLGLDQRIKEQIYPLLNYGSRYLHRMPIGLMDVVTKVGNDEELRKYYSSWYRPDLTSLMVVGNFDIEDVEKRIIETFGSIKVADDAPKREYYTMPEHDETFVAIIKDPEITSTSVRIVHKIPSVKAKTLGDLKREIVDIVYTYMLNQRLTDMAQNINAPFMYASSFAQSGGIGGRDRYTSFVSMKSDSILSATKSLLRELYRAKEFGFTQSEFERKRESLANDMERSAKETETKTTAQIMQALSSHVIYGDEYMDAEFRTAFVLKTIEEMTLADVNDLMKDYISKDDDNLVVIVQAPENVITPSKEEILNAMRDVADEELGQYKSVVIDAELMQETPKEGEIIRETFTEGMGITVLEFANGASVALKPTKFMADEIRFSSLRRGGYSLAEDENFDNASMAATLVNLGGLGEFNSMQLDQITSGKHVYVAPYIHRYIDGVTGFSSASDFETLLQLNYLIHTAPRKDAEQFKVFINNKKEYNKNQMNDPDSYYADGINRVMMQNSPRTATLLTAQQLDALDIDEAFEFYESRFSSAYGTRFFIVGSFDIETIKPLLTQYIGGLPSHKVATDFVDRDLRPAKGFQSYDFDRNTVYKTKVLMRFTGDYASSQQKRIELNLLSDILTIRLNESLREEIGGVYSPYSTVTTLQYPKENYRMDIYFTCSPDMIDTLMSAAMKEVEKLKNGDISMEDLDKVKKAWIKNRKGSLETNGYWRKVMEDQWTRGEDEDDFVHYESQINNTELKVLKKVARMCLKKENLIVFKLNPQEGVTAEK